MLNFIFQFVWDIIIVHVRIRAGHMLILYKKIIDSFENILVSNLG